MELVWQWTPKEPDGELNDTTPCVVRLFRHVKTGHSRLVGPVLRIEGTSNARKLTKALNLLRVDAYEIGHSRG